MLPIQFYIDQWSRVPPLKDGQSLHGRTVILTGATSGIGLEAALQLAALSPEKLIITARSAEAGGRAVDQILQKHPGTHIDCWDLDMSSYDSVKRFAARANKEQNKLDVLVANAGTQTGFNPNRKMDKTVDGNDNVIQTNVLSTVLIVLLLHPVLTNSDHPRVVFTTSDTAARADHKYLIDAVQRGRILQTFNDERLYVNPTRYFQSKLLLQLVVRHMIPALPNISIISTNPGLCYSRLNRHTEYKWNATGLRLQAWYRLNARSATVGARTIVWSAVEAPFESCEYSAQCRFEAFQSPFLSTLSGMRIAANVYTEVLAELEKVVPGCTHCLH